MQGCNGVFSLESLYSHEPTVGSGATDLEKPLLLSEC